MFGLGNKQYEHFNKMGKEAFRCLGALGGAPLLRRGDGDDDDAIDDDFDKWCGELHEALDARSDLVGDRWRAIFEFKLQSLPVKPSLPCPLRAAARPYRTEPPF